MGSGAVRVAVTIACLAGLAACGRNAAPMTECIAGKPAIERVEDVAPPTCDPVLPGVAAEGS
jgi:hypothetical protein